MECRTLRFPAASIRIDAIPLPGLARCSSCERSIVSEGTTPSHKLKPSRMKLSLTVSQKAFSVKSNHFIVAANNRLA